MLVDSAPAAWRSWRPPAVGVALRLWLLCLMLFSPVLVSTPLCAAEPVGVDLMTVEPGQVYWQRFGHNALIVSYDDGQRLSYNFGYFDFNQPGFLSRFLQGHMLYQALALDADYDVAGYLEDDRAVRIQRLQLDASALQVLDRHLRQHVQPENAQYRYDYYLNNCSTKVRDALDLALGGQLKRETVSRSRGLSFRDFTLASTAPVLWLYAGTHLGLGPAVDRPISLWEEQFLPAELAERVTELRLRNAVGGSFPLVVEDRVLGGDWPAPSPVPQRWPWWLLAGLAWGAAIRWLPGRFGSWLRCSSAALFGLVGVGLSALWLSDHWSAHRNENLFLFSPVWLLAVPALCGRGGRWSKRALWLATVLALAGVAIKVLPAFTQQNWEWVCLLAAPIAVLYWFGTQSSGDRAGVSQ